MTAPRTRTRVDGDRLLVQWSRPMTRPRTDWAAVAALTLLVALAIAVHAAGVWLVLQVVTS